MGSPFQIALLSSGLSSFLVNCGSLLTIKQNFDTLDYDKQRFLIAVYQKPRQKTSADCLAVKNESNN